MDRITCKQNEHHEKGHKQITGLAILFPLIVFCVRWGCACYTCSIYMRDVMFYGKWTL